MPVITEIRQNRNQRYSVYVDDQFLFNVSKEIILRYSLHKDDSINQDKIDEIQKESLSKDLFAYALRLLSFQNRTISEIIKRLETRTACRDVIDEIVEKLKNYNYIDSDDRYMEKVIEAKAGYGYYYFFQKFYIKGILKNIIRAKLDSYFIGEKEAEYAQICLEKHKKKLGNLKNIEKKRKIASLLKSRGFSDNIIFEKLGE